MELIVLSLISLIIVEISSASQPGIKTRITQSGLDFFTDAEQILSMLPEIPDFADKTEIAVLGKVDYDVTDVKIKRLSSHPQTVLAVERDFGLVWLSKELRVAVNGNWHYQTHGFIPVSDDGKFDFEVVIKSSPFKLKVDADDTGRLSIEMVDKRCHFKVESVDVELYGDKEWFYNMFEGNIEEMVQKYANEQICSTISKLIKEDLGMMMRSMEVVASVIPEVAALDLSLIARPAMTSFIDIGHRGEVYNVNNRMESSLPIPSLPEDNDDASMFYIWLTDYVLNSAGSTLHNCGYLSYSLTQDQIPEDTNITLNTSTYEVTLLLPQISKLYPNMEIQCNINSREPPTMKVSEDLVEALISADIAVSVVNEDKSLKHLFTVSKTIEMAGTLKVVDTQLTWDIESFWCRIDLRQSEVEDLDFDIVRSALEFACHAFIKQYIKEMGTTGVTLPELPGDLNLTDIQFSQGEGYVKIGFDLE